MSRSKIDEWAEGLLDRPVGMTDDYGNLMLSVGLAQQQRPQDLTVATPPPSHNASLHSGLSNGPPRSRGKACVTCHERKVKCDFALSGSPCTNCRKAGKSDCTPHKRRQQASGRQSNTNGSSTAADSRNDGQSPRHPYSPFPLHHARSSQGQEQLDPRLRMDEVQLSNVMQQPARDPDAGACQCALVDLLREEVGQQHSASPGRTQIENIGTASSSMQFLASRNAVLDQPATEIRGNSQIVTDGIVPDSADIDKYVVAYWERVNPTFPVLDWDDYHSLRSNNPNKLLLNAVMLVGAHIMASPDDRQLLKSRFYQNTKALFDADAHLSQETHVQAALLLSWQSDKVEGNASSTAWYWTNMARTIATDLGMHRNIERSTLDPRAKSRWRKLWWLIFHCDTWKSLHLGRPPSIHLEDCDVQPLSYNDLEVGNRDTDVYAVISMIQLAAVVSDHIIPCFRPTLSVSQRRTARSVADRALVQWESWRNANPGMEESSPPSLSQILLRLQYYSTLILVHRPDPGEKRLATRFTPADAAICHLAAKNITALMETIASQKQLKCLPHAIVPILLSAFIECFVETQISDHIVATDANEMYRLVREALYDLNNYWPDIAEILQRCDVSTEKLLKGQSGLAADLQGLEDSSAQQSQGDDMQIDGVTDVNNDNGAVVRFFGDESVAETAALRSVWREWRQVYWRWSHVRCV